MAIGGPLLAARCAIREREHQEAAQRERDAAAAAFIAAEAVAELAEQSPERREAREKEQRDQEQAKAERLAAIDRELAQRKLAEDKKYYDAINADPFKRIFHKTLGWDFHYTDEQRVEAKQWALDHPAEKIKTAGGGGGGSDG
jgi:hypothetical protein